MFLEKPSQNLTHVTRTCKEGGPREGACKDGGNLVYLLSFRVLRREGSFFFFVLGRARELICILSYTKCVCVLCVLALSTCGKWNTDSSQTVYEIVRKGVNEVINIKITFIY